MCKQDINFCLSNREIRNFVLYMPLLVICMNLSSCSSLPIYKVKGPLAVSIDIESTSGDGVLFVKKLTNDCREEAKFENIIGKNAKTLFVDATDKFTFQFIYYSPNLVGCKMQNTIAMKYGDSYRVLVSPPSTSSSKDQLCAVSLQVIPSDGSAFSGFSGMFGDWQPSQFEGTCAINQRF